MAKTNISSAMEALLTMDVIEIKKGGSYTVISNSGTDEPMKTEGEFIGYTLLGEEGAICFRVKGEDGKSKLRLIPVSGLIAIEFSDEELLKPKKKDHIDREKMTYIS
ncbi:MAG: hypothetical protein M1431_00560 [Candidatus Thermoplasmatota archaeon]|nr:hypothetical protein [Candidatus Thermoplasmatota archaeon]